MKLDLDAKKYFVSRYMQQGHSKDESYQLADLTREERQICDLDSDFLDSLPKGKSLGNKISHVIETVAATGMHPDQAMLLCDLDDEEAEFLDSHPLFVADIARVQAQREHTLLRQMKEVMESNLDRGISTELRWLMEKQYPNRYGNKISTEGGSFVAIPNPVVSERE